MLCQASTSPTLQKACWANMSGAGQTIEWIKHVLQRQGDTRKQRNREIHASEELKMDLSEFFPTHNTTKQLRTHQVNHLQPQPHWPTFF
jgi:hypothetical protein